MMQNKRIIGITGGSGCGKSYISKKLTERGFLVVDADASARVVMEKGHPCLAKTAAHFGEQILKNGELDRKKLAQIVFADEASLKKLNEITHKYILADIYDKIEKGKGETVFVDGAVLIESGMKCDIMIGVLADREVRKSRIMNRDGLSEQEADRRIGAQQKDDFYIERCDFVIYNNTGEPDIDYILKRIHQ